MRINDNQALSAAIAAAQSLCNDPNVEIDPGFIVVIRIVDPRGNAFIESSCALT